MRSATVFLFTASILTLPSCGDDKGDDTGLSGGTADTTTGAADPTSTTEVNSTSTTAPDDTTTAGTSGSETSPTSGESSSEAGTTTSEATTDATGVEATGDPAACEGLGQMECEDNAACFAIEGAKVNVEKECVGKSMFIECVTAAACGEAVTYACSPDTDPPEPFMFPSTCVPMGWQECEAPQADMPCK